jgi:lipoprotein-releasing system ATP-binding protein
LSERAAHTGDVVLEARGLTRSYQMGGRSLAVLAGADLALHAGERVAIMGRSGAGKSTLLHLLGLLDRPDGGSLAVRGQATEKLSRPARARMRNKEVGFVFQFYHLIPELTALENALLPSMISHSPLSWMGSRRRARDRVSTLLSELGLGDRLGHKPSQLSGGERQRVAIARALASDPSILLCDEPTGNLDERTSATISNLLFEVVARHGQTLVMVTHDPELAASADRTLQLHDGRLDTVEAVAEAVAEAERVAAEG